MAFAEGYIDVASRIIAFKEKHPGGSLQPFNPEKPIEIVTMGERVFLQYVACAYRSEEDPRPGIGIAWEPFPGKTPYTRDSEAMNVETSAWGRAIVAVLAADTHQGVASAEEIRNRRDVHEERIEPRPVELTPLAAAKARAWTVAKRMRPKDTDEHVRAFTESSLQEMGSSIADADAEAWNALADEWDKVMDEQARF